MSEIFPGMVVTESVIGTVEFIVSTESTDVIEIRRVLTAMKNATISRILTRSGHPRLRPLQSDIKEDPSPSQAARLSCREATVWPRRILS